MNRQNRTPLVDRVTQAAETALAAKGHVGPIDVLLGIRWLEPTAEKRWQQGQIECLEDAIQTNPSRVAEAIALFSAWATRKGLLASATPYLARTPHRRALRFTRGADPAIETQYRTRFLSPALPEKRRERVLAQASKPPDLVVIQPLKDTWKCHRCGGTGDLLVMEKDGPACLRCAGLDDLEFLPAGDAVLSRRAKASSERSAVVVRFSRNRKRYERQGLLVEPQSLADSRRIACSRKPVICPDPDAKHKVAAGATIAVVQDAAEHHPDTDSPRRAHARNRTLRRQEN